MMKAMISYAKLYLNEKEIIYQIRHSRKAKYLQLRINSINQLELIIPKRYSLKDAEKFLHNRINWIKKYQKNLVNNKSNFYLFGNLIQIKQHFNLFLEKHKVKVDKNILCFESPSESKFTIEDLYNSYLKKIAEEYLPKRVTDLAFKYGFNVNSVKIRRQKTRWGSCSSKGNLSFNYKLIKFRKEVIDYVIIHELCHLREMNHSKKFWELVHNSCPEYKTLKKELKSI